MSGRIADGESLKALTAKCVSPMAERLKEDTEAAFRDEILAQFEVLAAQANQAMRRPQSTKEYVFNEALFAAATLAGQVVSEYWARHHRDSSRRGI